MFTPSQQRPFTDEQLVHYVRNALLVAGQEMGKDGDQWPVINDTVERIMHDWDKVQTERAVHAEMKKHLYEQLDAMDRILPSCTPEEQAFAAPRLKQLREIYDAYFTNVDERVLYIEDTNVPMYIKRAEAIMDTLELVDA